jgi:hypothetical protein
MLDPVPDFHGPLGSTTRLDCQRRTATHLPRSIIRSRTGNFQRFVLVMPLQQLGSCKKIHRARGTYDQVPCSHRCSNVHFLRLCSLVNGGCAAQRSPDASQRFSASGKAAQQCERARRQVISGGVGAACKKCGPQGGQRCVQERTGRAPCGLYVHTRTRVPSHRHCCGLYVLIDCSERHGDAHPRPRSPQPHSVHAGP